MPPSSSPTFLDRVERWLLRAIVLAVALLALLLSFAAWHSRHQASTAGAAAPLAAPATSSITLVIDYNDGVQRRFTDLPFSPGMSVLDAMTLARTHARPLAFDSKGSGEQSLITRIDDLHNEGATSDPATSKNWQFWVNGVYSEISAGAAKLAPGDRVSWAFRPYGKDRTPPP